MYRRITAAVRRSRLAIAGLGLVAATVLAPPALAGPGDLLVAPTRVILDGATRSTEVVLNNIGAATATYRITAEIRRMTPAGEIVDVPEAEQTELDRQALAMVQHSPRRVTLPPNQPQVIRVGLRRPEGLADGEYRVHLLFRAVPEASSVEAPTIVGNQGGISIALTPIYGVSIPVIVRSGALDAKAAIGRSWVERDADGQAMFHVELTRTGSASTYGEIEVTAKGAKEPILLARGIAVYPEVGQRRVSLPLTEAQAAKMTGPVDITYRADRARGGATLAAASTTLN